MHFTLMNTNGQKQGQQKEVAGNRFRISLSSWPLHNVRIQSPSCLPLLLASPAPHPLENGLSPFPLPPALPQTPEQGVFATVTNIEGTPAGVHA